MQRSIITVSGRGQIVIPRQIPEPPEYQARQEADDQGGGRFCRHDTAAGRPGRAFLRYFPGRAVPDGGASRPATKGPAGRR